MAMVKKYRAMAKWFTKGAIKPIAGMGPASTPKTTTNNSQRVGFGRMGNIFEVLAKRKLKK